jgi:hypothetical protein
MISSAVIDDCYRYELVRIWDATRPLLSIVMVNPLTADHRNDDQTIKKVIGFAKLLGYGGIIVVNLFAFRAKDVNELRTAIDPIGPMNSHHQFCAIARTQMTIVAWGALGKLPERLRDQWRQFAAMARSVNRSLYCLGTCNDGHPKHPCMIGYDSPLVQWSY